MNRIMTLTGRGHRIVRRSELARLPSVPQRPMTARVVPMAGARAYSAQVKTSPSGLQVGHNVPSIMKYMAHDPAAGPESLTVHECESPQYNRDTEVLIKIEATAANRADLLQVSAGFVFEDLTHRFVFYLSRKESTQRRRGSRTSSDSNAEDIWLTRRPMRSQTERSWPCSLAADMPSKF